MKRKYNVVDIVIIVSLALLFVLLLLPLFVPSKEEAGGIADENGDGQVTLADYSGKKIGVISGVNYDEIINACIFSSIDIKKDCPIKMKQSLYSLLLF